MPFELNGSPLHGSMALEDRSPRLFCQCPRWGRRHRQCASRLL